MNNYCVIATADLTQAMKNRAVQPFTVVTVTISSVEHHIVEVPRTELIQTDIFDGYIWYTAIEARDIKDTGTLP